MPNGKKVLIVGCGYLGMAIAARLRQSEYTVTGWVRSEDSAAHLHGIGIAPFIGDASAEIDWKRLKSGFDSVIHCASSGRGGADAYRSVYLKGMRQVIHHLPKAKIIFISSTSVYGQNKGEIVTEESLAEPAAETGKILRETEEIGLKSGAIVMRLGGIYGPGRSVYVDKLRSGEAVIEGDGLRWINQIHRDDAAAAVIHALDRRKAGEIYNVCDNEPVNTVTFYEWLAPRLDKPVPPFGPVNPARKRGLTNKRVLNEKLRNIGWMPVYPTFREGYAAILASD